MIGSSLESGPALIVRPHNAQIVLPSSFFVALAFADNALLFRCGIGKGSNLKKALDSGNFRGGGGDFAKALLARRLRNKQISTESLTGKRFGARGGT